MYRSCLYCNGATSKLYNIYFTIRFCAKFVKCGFDNSFEKQNNINMAGYQFQFEKHVEKEAGVLKDIEKVFA